jgi:hypothetical protein
MGMNIHTVADNLRNTIAGKVKHQVELEYALTLSTMAEGTALTATLAYLKINIDELRRILEDVEQCEPSLPGEGNNYEKWDGDE